MPSIYSRIATVFMTAILVRVHAQGSGSVRLSLKGANIINNGFVAVNDIGEGDAALLCNTNKPNCCGVYPYRAGEWYFPCTQDMKVGRLGDLSSNNGFYRNRGSSVVRLNRRGSPSERGCFRCEVPDARNVNQIIFANIVDIGSVRIYLSETISGTVGEMLILSCSADIGLTGNSLPQNVAIEWFFGPDNSTLPNGVIVSNVTNNSSTYTSTLQFSPLNQSHAGMYTCRLGGNQKLAASTNVTISVNKSEVFTTVAVPVTSDSDTVSNPSSDGAVIATTVKSEVFTTVPVPVTSDSDTAGNPSSNIAVIATTAVLIMIVIAAVITVVAAAVVVYRKRQKKNEFEEPYYSIIERPTALMWKKKLPQITEFPTDLSAIEGKAVYLIVKVDGELQPRVTWYHNEEPIEEDYAHEIEADGSLVLPSVEMGHSGIYKAVISNEHGTVQQEMKLVVREEIEKTETTVSVIVYSRPIPVSNFVKYVAELHTDANQPFKDLFQALDSGENGRSTNYATDPQRNHLNRFGNIVVYDDSLIILKPLPDYEDYQRDYINASYVDGHSISSKFIAAQGPLPETEMDFWWLIWQEQVSIIVMLTNEVNKFKCQQYWPDSGKKQLGPFHLIIADQQIFANYTIRILSVSLGYKHSHKVTQYHYTAWPDHGVPEFGTSLLSFHRRVEAHHHSSRGPILVHCSAGVGRTGTFIAIDNVLEQIEKEQVVDVPGAITKIRQRRMKMVQNYKQFVFIHDTIVESIICGDTEIMAGNLEGAISKMKNKNTFQHQLKILDQVSPNLSDIQCSIALAHPDKNKDNNYLPSDCWRVTLRDEHPDYIHAVFINGYKQRKAFIIAQGPMESTVRNFWKMICDRKSAVVVMLSDLVEGGQEASAQYWPSSGSYQYEEYAVELLEEKQLQDFVVRNLSVMDIKTQSTHQVTQLHIINWSANGQCSNLESIIYVVEEMTKEQMRTGNQPIVIHCSDTVTRSGMFCAIATTIERCKTEGVVDVFQVVKALRMQKPGAVPTVDDYTLIFEAVLVFLKSFESYANFQ